MESKKYISNEKDNIDVNWQMKEMAQNASDADCLVDIFFKFMWEKKIITAFSVEMRRYYRSVNVRRSAFVFHLRKN